MTKNITQRKEPAKGYSAHNFAGSTRQVFNKFRNFLSNFN
ncbi:hypothetical protein SAMN04487894_101155 [Niabella drilacis]|uniref:Uncharacterized protein n=1 Tax=Niabella drilacis (strain DSM 25811 / CCM 8410 / CCUG 62505 / LMG 26954 / E90) TaxID=1285928 RepID=A0A1G6IAH6_NIADE|nr:hypothetical protein SAMN04487894_101155 [Niabella drilacis]